MTQQPTVVVRGSAFREVPPELAQFAVSVTARDRAKETLLDRLTGRAAELRAVLDGYGDAIERRETGGVQVYPEFKRGGERGVVYHGSVETMVTVTDFAVLGEMLPRLAGLGEAAISGPWWRLRPGNRAGADVRREAIADALARAREYAEAVGSRIDRLVEIADDGLAGDTGGSVFLAGAAMERADAPTIALDPQQQTVRASVTVRVTITDPDLSS